MLSFLEVFQIKYTILGAFISYTREAYAERNITREILIMTRRIRRSTFFKRRRYRARAKKKRRNSSYIDTIVRGAARDTRLALAFLRFLTRVLPRRDASLYVRGYINPGILNRFAWNLRGKKRRNPASSSSSSSSFSSTSLSFLSSSFFFFRSGSTLAARRNVRKKSPGSLSIERLRNYGISAIRIGAIGRSSISVEGVYHYLRIRLYS